MDKEKIEQAVRLFLEGIGEDPNREGLLGTPDALHVCAAKYMADWGRMQDNICIQHLKQRITS